MRQATSENSEQPSLASDGGTAQNPKPITIDTRFGAVEIDPATALVFEHGLLGVPNSRLFGLSDFPSPKLAQFKLLQSLEDKNLSFITLPLALDNALIERADLEKAVADINFSLENLTVFVIVSVHRTPSEVKLSVNVRAPLLIDTVTRNAMQYVFQHSRYKVQHFLETPGA